ncbi:MAG: hypothetical protein WD830_05675 [Chloroflexota bacterium]
MEEQTLREHAEGYCEALVAGDIERASEDLSEQLRANLGQLVAMLPMPLTTATVESLERTASGFRAVLHLVGETDETRLETRWKDRDDRPVIVEVSHLTEQAAAPAVSEPETPTED